MSKEFSESRSVKAHQRVHTGGRLYKRDLCQKSFFCRVICIGARVHTGDIFRKNFSESGSLNKHQRVQGYIQVSGHININVCQNSFSQSCSSKTHQRIHIDERPYKCDLS